jgi:hypothetical protein
MYGGLKQHSRISRIVAWKCSHNKHSLVSSFSKDLVVRMKLKVYAILVSNSPETLLKFPLVKFDWASKRSWMQKFTRWSLLQLAVDENLLPSLVKQFSIPMNHKSFPKFHESFFNVFKNSLNHNSFQTFPIFLQTQSLKSYLFIYSFN